MLEFERLERHPPAMHRGHAPFPHPNLQEQQSRRQLVDSWDKNCKSVPTLQALALRKCAERCLLNPDFAMKAAEKMPVSLFEVLGDIAKNVLRTLPRGNVMAPERFDQRHAAAAAAEAEGESSTWKEWLLSNNRSPTWLVEKLGGNPSLVSSDARQVCPFLDPEFHRSVRQHGEPKTPSGCPCDLLHMQLYSKKPLVLWMRLLMQVNPSECSKRWCARTLIHLALMNLGYNPWTAPEDNLQLLMFHFGLTVGALEEMLLGTCLPHRGRYQSHLQCQWVSPYFRSLKQRGTSTWSQSASNSVASVSIERETRETARFPLLEGSSFQKILLQEVRQHLTPAVLRVLGVARGIQLCQADPERARRAARQLPDVLYTEMERNCFRVLGCQSPWLSSRFRQEVRVLDMLQSKVTQCPCKMVASCSECLYDHCKANALDSRSDTARWMARCWIHCEKGWPREVTYDPDTAQIIAEEFLAHKFQATENTLKVLVDLTNLGYEEGPSLFLNAVHRQLDVSSGLEHLLHCAAQQRRLSLARFALRLGAEVSAQSLSLAAGTGHLELFELLWKSSCASLKDNRSMYQHLLLEGCRSGSVEIVTKIMSSIPDPCVDFEFEDEKGITPLYVAATWGYPELVKYLLQKEANPRRRDLMGMTPLRVILQAEAKVSGGTVDRQAQRFKGLRFAEVVELLEAQCLPEPNVVEGLGRGVHRETAER